MWLFHRLRSNRKMSEKRKDLWMVKLEGIPSVLIFQLLGGPFLTGYLLYLGATTVQIGYVLALTTLVNVAQIWMAFLMQKIKNRRWTFLIFGGLHRVLWVSTGWLPFLFAKEWQVDVFMMIYTLAFLSHAAELVVWSSIIGDVVPVSVRGRYFGILNMFLSAVGSLALFIGGQIMGYYPSGEGFRIIFSICAVCAVLNTLIFAFYPNPTFEKSQETNLISMLKKPFRDVLFLKAMLFLSLWLFLQGITVPFFSYVMLNTMHISYQWVSIITIVQTIFTMIGFYVWGNLETRFNTKQTLLWTLPVIASSCLFWGMTPLLPTFFVLLIVHILLGIGTGGFNQLAFMFIIGDTPKSDRPMYIAAYAALTGIAGFLGAMLGGWIYEELVKFPLWVQTYGISTGIGVILLLLVLFGRGIFTQKRESLHHLTQ